MTVNEDELDDCERRCGAAGKLVTAAAGAITVVGDLAKLLDVTAADDSVFYTGSSAPDAAESAAIALRALRDIRRIAQAGTTAFTNAPNGDGQGDTVLSSSSLLPAEIVNYRTMGSTPALVAAGVAAGAVVALGLTLAASVRRRRRDLALLKALGFTGRQVLASVATQATVVGIVGLIVGLPLGIALGRWLWVLFAHEIYAVPEPTVPVVGLVLVGVATLVLVNVVALLPGRAAAHTPTALVLRAE